jgi:hypothetical protein
MIVTKPIKPTALKKEAMVKAINDELQKTSKDILFDFEATAWNWKHKVKFTREVSVGPNSADILVGTDDEIYGYVDQGTKAHVVEAKHAKMLHYWVGGTPKTQPGVMVSGAGSPGNKEIFIRKNKKSTKTITRKFTKTIQKEWKPKFKSRMEKAMHEAVVASGHEMK